MVANKYIQKLPVQKSIWSKTVSPWLMSETNKAPMAVIKPRSVTAACRLKSNPSSRNAIAGCSIDKDDVIAAIKSRKKKSPPKK